MAITLNGTTGIANVDGSAASPAFRNTDANSGVSGSADQVVISTAGSERLRLASAGQLGIGGANYGTDGQVLTSTGASSAPAWEAAAGGKILSYQYAGSSSTYSNTSSSTTFADTVVTDSITTTKLNSKILVQANFRCWGGRTGGGDNVIGTRVRRAEGGADEFIFMNNSQNWKGHHDEVGSEMGGHIWVDTPNKSAGTAITYTIQMRLHDTGGSQTMQVDSWHMVLMELDV